MTTSQANSNALLLTDWSVGFSCRSPLHWVGLRTVQLSINQVGFGSAIARGTAKPDLIVTM